MVLNTFSKKVFSSSSLGKKITESSRIFILMLCVCVSECVHVCKIWNVKIPQETLGNSFEMYNFNISVQKQDDQHEHTFSNYVRIRDVVQKTCRRRWTIGKSGERGSGISVLPARHDDDDDDVSSQQRFGFKTWSTFLGFNPQIFLPSLYTYINNKLI